MGRTPCVPEDFVVVGPAAQETDRVVGRLVLGSQLGHMLLQVDLGQSCNVGFPFKDWSQLCAGCNLVSVQHQKRYLRKVERQLRKIFMVNANHIRPTDLISFPIG